MLPTDVVPPVPAAAAVTDRNRNRAGVASRWNEYHGDAANYALDDLSNENSEAKLFRMRALS